MIGYALAIAIPVAVFIGGCAAILHHKYRDEDPAPFNWQGTVPAAPGHCSCGVPHVRKLAPFPGDVLVLPAPAAKPAPAAAPAPAEPAADSAWDRHQVDDVWALLNAEAKP
jgi:hypothetical protein